MLKLFQTACLLLTIGSLPGCGRPALAESEPPAKAGAFAYGTPAFDEFVRHSYEEPAAKGVENFHAWLNSSMLKHYGLSTSAWAEIKRKKLAAASNRAAAEVELGKELHNTIKKIVPRYSLDRGFEFHIAVSRGERQCFLQSVLICSLAQSAGVDAGVVMVNRNIKGNPTNNGHAVAMFQLPNGRHLLVDGSIKGPFAEQKGLFAYVPSDKDYRYVVPIYAAGSQISGYKHNGAALAAKDVEHLPNDFLASQFDYYRGERAPNGIFAKKPTPAGLAASARYLERAVQHCPENPLAVYQLGRTLMKLKQMDEAKPHLDKARVLYARYGWTPDGLKAIKL